MHTKCNNTHTHTSIQKLNKLDRWLAIMSWHYIQEANITDRVLGVKIILTTVQDSHW